MKKLYRGPYIDAFCQVWFHLLDVINEVGGLLSLKYSKTIPPSFSEKDVELLVVCISPVNINFHFEDCIRLVLIIENLKRQSRPCL
jgi:hypothetical protein